MHMRASTIYSFLCYYIQKQYVFAYLLKKLSKIT